MRTNKEILIEAYQRGRSWDSSKPNLLNLDLASVETMDGTESDAKLLIASLQESDSNMFTLADFIHHRPLIVDGEIGPATQALVELKRCPLPDFAPPPGASFHYDDPELQRAVETMQENALAGSGSWLNCDPEHPEYHSIRVRIDPNRMPANTRAYRDKIVEACVKASAEMGLAKRYIFDATSDCEMQKRFESLSGSVIGWNEFPQPNTCNQTINGRFDTGYDPSDWRLTANLWEHEEGHGLGLQHTRGHIMNPSILLVWPLSWKGGPSEASMRRYFGGVPIIVGSPVPQENPSITGTIFGEQNSSGGISIRGNPTLSLPANFPAGIYKYTIKPGSIPGQYEFVKKIEV